MPTPPAPLATLTPRKPLRGVFADIDDTLTLHGTLVPGVLQALHDLRESELIVVPITGRPGGWVDHIARMWPVDGVVGENGGLWFYMHEGKLQRHFLQDSETRAANKTRLVAVAKQILAAVPGCALASDQPYRELDLAIDFCEDVPPLSPEAIDQIVAEFESVGATCKVSSIHVNGWFGDFDKLTGCKRFLADRYGIELDPDEWVYAGDSANDEPMFATFPAGVGVANVVDFLPRMDSWPAYITPSEGGEGFLELAAHLLR